MNNKEVLVQLGNKKSYLGSYYYMFRLQCLFGLRVSEVLRIKESDIFENGQILIKGSKGSSDRFVCDSQEIAFWENQRVYNCCHIKTWDRFSARRHLIRLGIETQKVGNKNKSQTSAFRDMLVRDIKKTVDNKSEIATIVGHKSLKSQDHYGN